MNPYNRKRSEATEQIRVIDWSRWRENKYPELKLLHHVPNGGSRNKMEAQNLKREGVKSGVPDLVLPVARKGFHGLYIEMKFGKNKTTTEQEEWLIALRKQGYKTAVCYGAEEAIPLIMNYLEMEKEPFNDWQEINIPTRLEEEWFDRTKKNPCDPCIMEQAICDRCMFGYRTEEQNRERLEEVYKSGKEPCIKRKYEEVNGKKDWENKEKITAKELIEILGKFEPETVMINGDEKNIRLYPGRENKKYGKTVIMIC